MPLSYSWHITKLWSWFKYYILSKYKIENHFQFKIFRTHPHRPRKYVIASIIIFRLAQGQKSRHAAIPGFAFPFKFTHLWSNWIRPDLSIIFDVEAAAGAHDRIRDGGKCIWQVTARCASGVRSLLIPSRLKSGWSRSKTVSCELSPAPGKMGIHSNLGGRARSLVRPSFLPRYISRTSLRVAFCSWCSRSSAEFRSGSDVHLKYTTKEWENRKKSNFIQVYYELGESC